MKWKISIVLILCVMLAFLYLYFKPDTDLVYNNTNNSISIEHKNRKLTNKHLENKEIIEAQESDCNDLIKPNKEVSQWKKDKKTYIKDLLLNLKKQGNKDIILDYISINSGIGLKQGRKIRELTPNSYKTPIYYDGKLLLATFEEEQLVNDSIAEQAYDPIYDAIKNHTIRNNIYLPDEKQLSFLFSYLIKSANENKTEVIENLINSGVQIHYADLVMSSQMNLPAHIVEMIFNASDLRADKVLKRFGRHTSLALLSLEAYNSELALLWISLGSPLQPDNFGMNAMDLLVKHSEKYDKSTFKQLFTTISAQHIYPHYEQTYTKLSLILPDNLFTNYKEDSINSKPNLTSAENEKIDDTVDKIYANILSGIVYFKLNSVPKHQCFYVLGKKLTRFSLKNKSRKKSKVVEKSIEKPNIDPLLTEAKNKFSSDYDIEAYLGSKNTLNSKRAIELYRQEKLNKLVSEMKNDSDIDPIKEEILIKIYKLAKQQKWSEAINLLENFDIQNDELLNTLIVLAINTNAEFSIIKDFLDKGGKLLPNTISTLIRNDNSTLAKQLMDYGLNINTVDLLGSNSISQAVKNKALSMFMFLIDEGAEINNSSVGYDALDIALMQFTTNKGDLIYIDKLIANGARIELSHKQISAEIRNEKLNYYIELIGRNPELIP